MSRETIFTNARIVGADTVFLGSLGVRDGIIVEIDDRPSGAPGAIDCGSDYLVPGLVELHTDNLERHITPRPKVRWHPSAATLAHDAQMAAAGITTVFDAISCGDVIEGSERLANLDAMVGAISDGQACGMFRTEHRLHLRCEVSSPNIVALYEAFADNPLVGIVSLMDHTPGQRQFVHEVKYREYYMGKYGFSDAEMEAFTRRQQDASATYSEKHRRLISDASRRRGQILASHDDATVAHVDEAVALGTDFSEFPTTVEAAQAAKRNGMMVLMGAPNMVRGGSHSGNVSAAELLDRSCLDVLSSDYVPHSLLYAAFSLHRGARAMPLPDAMALVAANPARVAGLDDRGVIAVGRRADLVRVNADREVPVVRGTWRQGQRAA